MNHTISVDLSKPNEFVTTQHYNTCRNSRLFIEVKPISVSIYELNVFGELHSLIPRAFHFICIRDDRTKKSYVGLLLLAHSTRWNDNNNGIVNDTIWTHSLPPTHSWNIRGSCASTRLLLYICFPFICPIWKAAFIIVILLASLPHHLCIVVLRIRIAPIKLCRLFAYAQIYTNFFLHSAATTTMSLFAIRSHLDVVAIWLRSTAIRRPFNHERDYFIIYFLSGAFCDHVLRFVSFFCIQKGKQRVALRSHHCECVAFFIMRFFFSSIFLVVLESE